MNTEIFEEPRDKVVYVHKLNGVIKYIGSGAEIRVTTKGHRVPFHLQIWDSLEKEIVQANLTEEQAKDLEQELINAHWDSGNLLNKSKLVDKVKKIEYSKLSQVLYYDESSATCLRWKVDSGWSGLGFMSKADSEAGSKTKAGRSYSQIWTKFGMFSTHRVIFCLVNKIDIPTHLVVDHIDRDRTNNKISNLRLVSQRLNAINRPVKKNNTGERCITDQTGRQYIKVHYKLDGKPSETIFSYNQNRSSKPRGNHYPTKELALEAAIKYRNELIEQGIILTV